MDRAMHLIRPWASFILSLLTVLCLPSTVAARAAPEPCSSPEHRQFDFWVGEWEVYRPDGVQAGRNVITPVMGGCVLHESYDGANGYHGESFNVFDASRATWHQSWVDNQGLLLLLEGRFQDARMVLEGQTTRPDGTPTLQRISWSLVDDDPDRVRQLWQSSTDGGSTWTVVFDGEYHRVGG
jgi:hypothetical protein